MMHKCLRKVLFVATKCNVLTASYAIICKLACCWSHFKTPSDTRQMGFFFKIVPKNSPVYQLFSPSKSGATNCRAICSLIGLWYARKII